MDDYPTRIADLLESIATKARSMTVDRAAKAVTWVALLPLLLVLAFLTFLFLFIGGFRILGELIGMRVAYAVVGGLFALLGVLLWSKRKPKPEADE